MLKFLEGNDCLFDNALYCDCYNTLPDNGDPLTVESIFIMLISKFKINV